METGESKTGKKCDTDESAAITRWQQQEAG
jgi:hypothetical protein